MNDVIENASRQSIFITLLGIAAAALGGNAAVGTAASSLGNQATLSAVLANSRINEESADAAAIKFLHRAGYSAAGLRDFMAKLMDEELLPASRQEEYVRTHPLSQDRFNQLKRTAAEEKNKRQPSPAAEEAYARIRSKLRGYVNPRQVIRDSDAKGGNIAVRYGRAVALWRLSDVAGASKVMDELITAEPDNPFFLELRGQLQLEQGKAAAAAETLARAARDLPNAALIQQSYGQALLANNQNGEAIPPLLRAVQLEPDSANARRLLATAYGRQGKTGEAQLELAEEALLTLNFREALARAKNTKLPAGSPGALRAADIAALAEEKIKEQDEKSGGRTRQR